MDEVLWCIKNDKINMLKTYVLSEFRVHVNSKQHNLHGVPSRRHGCRECKPWAVCSECLHNAIAACGIQPRKGAFMHACAYDILMHTTFQHVGPIPRCNAPSTARIIHRDQNLTGALYAVCCEHDALHIFKTYVLRYLEYVVLVEDIYSSGFSEYPKKKCFLSALLVFWLAAMQLVCPSAPYMRAKIAAKGAPPLQDQSARCHTFDRDVSPAPRR